MCLIPGAAMSAQEPDGVFGVSLGLPVGDRRLHERLVRVGGGGLELGAADDDAVVVLGDDAQQHVRVLVLRPLRPVTLGVGVGRHVERVLQRGAAHVPLDVLAERGVDLVEHVLAVVQRPHLAHRLVTDAGDDAACGVEDRVDTSPLGVPVLLRQRRLRPDRARLAGLLVDVSHRVRGGLVVPEVIDASPGCRRSA